MKAHYITCDIENDIAILQINNPPANELSSKVINELSNTLDLLAERKDVKSNNNNREGEVLLYRS